MRIPIYRRLLSPMRYFDRPEGGWRHPLDDNRIVWVDAEVAKEYIETAPPGELVDAICHELAKL